MMQSRHTYLVTFQKLKYGSNAFRKIAELKGAGAAGNTKFVGEDRIDHTPKNEKVRRELKN